MKNTMSKILVIALTVAMVLSMAAPVFAFNPEGSQQAGGLTGTFTDEPVVVDSGNTITFVHGDTYELTAKPGTSKSGSGDVLVPGVEGIIPENKIPGADGSDEYYNVIAWAIKDENDELVIIDLKTYKFSKNTKVYAITEDTWPPYTDMAKDRSDWFYQYARDLSVSGVVNGYPGNTVMPQGKVTWGEALKMIMLATGYEVQEPTADHWASGYLTKAEADGLVEVGYVTNLNKQITRLEYAQVASKAMKLKNVNIETPFADTEAQEVLNLYVAEIVEGSFDDAGNRLFKPDDLITRAEMFAVIWRINNYYKAN